jgi:hypothetical protein
LILVSLIKRSKQRGEKRRKQGRAFDYGFIDKKKRTTRGKKEEARRDLTKRTPHPVIRVLCNFSDFSGLSHMDLKGY